jgi:hypothetical protein
MQEYEDLVARQNAAKDSAFQGVEIRTVIDIQNVLKQLDPEDLLNKPVADITVRARVSGHIDDNASAAFNISSQSSTKSHRDILLEGFGVMLRRNEASDKEAIKEPEPNIVINGREMPPPDVIAGDEAALSIDPLIERLLGGDRRGHYICWDLDDGFTYRYEIFQHRLTRRPTDSQDGLTQFGAVAED